MNQQILPRKGTDLSVPQRQFEGGGFSRRKPLRHKRSVQGLKPKYELLRRSNGTTEVVPIH